MLLLVFLCISPCLSNVMPDKTNTEHLQVLHQEKVHIVLEEKLKAVFEDALSAILDNKLKDIHLRANVSNDQTTPGKPQKIDFAQTLQFGRVISPKSCYAVGFLKYRVIIEKCANFDDATEAAILTLNFNPTSADSHRQTMHSIALKAQKIV